MQNAKKSFWNSYNVMSAAKVSNYVSIGGRDRTDRFRTACAFIMHMATGDAGAGIQTGGDSIHILERLAKLHDAGVISAVEFDSKKARFYRGLM
ncbi:MAG: SHOCT domain-containing protein [Formivibrio sp.]|nr:SHOCT domain-containing protein [Formivibrio sp.]